MNHLFNLNFYFSHVDSTEDGSKLTSGGYYCPQCFSKYCELPVECRACGLTLVSAPHLARSYHHLFPAANYIEVNFNNQTFVCFACQKLFGELDKQVLLAIKSLFNLKLLMVHFLGLQLS